MLTEAFTTRREARRIKADRIFFYHPRPRVDAAWPLSLCRMSATAMPMNSDFPVIFQGPGTFTLDVAGDSFSSGIARPVCADRVWRTNRTRLASGPVWISPCLMNPGLVPPLGDDAVEVNVLGAEMDDRSPTDSCCSVWASDT